MAKVHLYLPNTFYLIDVDVVFGLCSMLAVFTMIGWKEWWWNLNTACVEIKIAVSCIPPETFCPTYFSSEKSLFCSNNESCWLTICIAQVEVSIDQWGSVVEVLRHVVQPVGLHAFDPLITVLHSQWHLDSVVLHLALSDRRVVIQSEQLHPC